MKLRTLAVATTVALIASLAPTTAEAAPKRAYQVSIKVSRTQADVGQTVRIAGRVAGPKATKKRLAIQRKVGHGTWRTVKKVRTTSRARYSAAVKVTTAGRQYFRVVAPKSSKRRAGHSKGRALTGYRWLDLTTQPGNTLGSDAPTRGAAVVAGRTYPKALTFHVAGLAFDILGRCTTFKATAGVPDNAPISSAEIRVVTLDRLDSTTPTSVDTPLTGGRAPVALRASLTGQRVFGLTDRLGTVAVISPQARCSVNSLPRLVMP